jgi:hypothetical protein
MSGLILPGDKAFIYPDARTQEQIDAHVAASDPHTGYVLESAIGWQDWVPTYTNLNIGSTGTTVARYRLIEGRVEFRWEVILGGTGISVGDVRISLPVTAVSTGYTVLTSPLGLANLLETGVANYAGRALYAGTTEFAIRYENTATAPSIRLHPLTSTIPFTWAADDSLSSEGWIEAA